jgi:hypothetical protein
MAEACVSPYKEVVMSELMAIVLHCLSEAEQSMTRKVLEKIFCQDGKKYDASGLILMLQRCPNSATENPAQSALAKSESGSRR